MKKIAIAAILLLNGLILHSQLTVTTGLNNADLANLLTGFGVNITNVQINCNPTSYGEFTGNSEIPINHGLMLSTGYINNIIGANSSPNTGDDNLFGGYIPLSNEVGASTFNACVISFDCVPIGDTLLFNFGFGSEEYPEYVGSQFNDIFAIYFSDSSGVTSNAALVPGTSVPVAINNVNHLTNSSYYIDNAAGVNVGFDGLTQNLQAFAVVIPGNTYHYTIAIADVGDGIYDSGVLLEAFSFRSSPPQVNIEEMLSSTFTLFPVPTNDQLQIKSNTNLMIETVVITNALGSIVSSRNIMANQTSLDLSSMETGLYMITVYTSKGKFTKKIIKN